MDKDKYPMIKIAKQKGINKMDMFDNVLLGVSESVANLQLPDPYLRNLYRDEEDRVYWLDGPISEENLDLVKMIMRCNREDKRIREEDRKPIKVFIDSPGGDVTVEWSIINAIKCSKTKIITINYCTAFSAAADILASGHERLALPGTHVMMHNGSCSYGGQSDAVESQKKYFDGLNKKITDHILSVTKLNPRVYKKKAITDWFFDENDALESGIIDQVVTDFDDLY